MILTEEFVNKQCSDNARTFFEMATSLGYTILCPEDETGSLKHGFMLQNQYGVLYSCPAGETALEAMTPILRFVIDFDRAGASTSAQPSRIDRLEERIDRIEAFLKTSPAIESQEAVANETKLDELKRRARNIHNRIIVRADKRLMYCRYFIFTNYNILETQQARWHTQGKWTFEQNELDVLEAVIAHDEAIYREHCTD